MIDVNFKKISRKDLLEKKKIIESAIENKNDGIIDRNAYRQDLVEANDKSFFNHVMLLFESNQKTNSCFINNLKDRSDSDFSKSYNVQLDPLNTCLKLENKKEIGEYFTREIFSNEKADSTMNNFYLIVEQDVPKNSIVKYFIVTDNDEMFPIESNNKNALVMKDNNKLPKSIRIKAYMKQGSGDMQIRIKGIALLYNDSYIEKQVDIFNPEFDRDIIEAPEDIITLYRDPGFGDRLYMVESPEDKINLNYDKNGELSFVDTFSKRSNKLSEKVELIYDDYLNSEGRVEKVLTNIRTKNALFKGEINNE